MRIEKDFVEFLELLNKHKVEYCIIGAFAVGFHGAPRYTKDLDILIKPTVKNCQKMVKVLKEFGFENLKLTANDFAQKENIIWLGYEPVRIDILNSINGCKSEEIWKNRIKGKYGNQEVYFIGYNQLAKNKSSSTRLIDKADLEKLQKIQKIMKK